MTWGWTSARGWSHNVSVPAAPTTPPLLGTHPPLGEIRSVRPRPRRLRSAARVRRPQTRVHTQLHAGDARLRPCGREHGMARGKAIRTAERPGAAIRANAGRRPIGTSPYWGGTVCGSPPCRFHRGYGWGTWVQTHVSRGQGVIALRAKPSHSPLGCTASASCVSQLARALPWTAASRNRSYSKVAGLLGAGRMQAYRWRHSSTLPHPIWRRRSSASCTAGAFCTHRRSLPLHPCRTHTT
jgi:hypothetical protein